MLLLADTPIMIPITGGTDCRVLNILILIFDVYCVSCENQSTLSRVKSILYPFLNFGKDIIKCSNFGKKSRSKSS